METALKAHENSARPITGHVEDWVHFFATPAEILIVDDENHILNLFSKLCEHWNCRLSTCTRGERAVDLVRDNDYRLVLLDLRLPGIDGIETFRQIRAMKKRTPVAILSGFIDEVSIARVQEIGFAIFICKPFPPPLDGFISDLFTMLGILKLPLRLPKLRVAS